MPQMNPMNWLVLFLYFSSILVGCMAKLHFSKLSSQDSLAGVKEMESVKKFPVSV